MKRKVRALHELRGKWEVGKRDLAVRREAWERANRERLKRQDALGIAIADIEAELKAERIKMYDGEDKSKMIGVGIRVSDKPDYIHDDAFNWAMEKKLALSLNVKEFEKLAKAMELDFVTMRSVVTATIAADLAPYLAAYDDWHRTDSAVTVFLGPDRIDD